MDSLQFASERMSSARRHLITMYPEGEHAGISLALADVRRAVDAIGMMPLESQVAQRWVERLRELLGGDDRTEMALRIDHAEFMGTVDELASWLYWREPASV